MNKCNTWLHQTDVNLACLKGPRQKSFFPHVRVESGKAKPSGVLGKNCSSSALGARDRKSNHAWANGGARRTEKICPYRDWSR